MNIEIDGNVTCTTYIKSREINYDTVDKHWWTDPTILSHIFPFSSGIFPYGRISKFNHCNIQVVLMFIFWKASVVLRPSSVYRANTLTPTSYTRHSIQEYVWRCSRKHAIVRPGSIYLYRIWKFINVPCVWSLLILHVYEWKYIENKYIYGLFEMLQLMTHNIENDIDDSKILAATNTGSKTDIRYK